MCYALGVEANDDAALAVREGGAGGAGGGGASDIVAAETLARWLDDRFLDPLMGFFLPGVGDVIGSALGLYVVVVAWRRKLPLVTISRMLLNLGIDGLVGAVPIAGDLFDVAWKANRRNVRLLRERHDARHDTAGDWLRVAGALTLLVAALAVPVAAAWWLVHFVASLLR